MILPRLIIADEHNPGKVPSSVLIATALRDMGYRLRIFAGSADETLIRSLQILCGQPVTLLDPLMCGDKANFRWLFQTAASPDCLNLVITNLGGRLFEDSDFRVPKECLMLAEWLECEIVPVINSNMSSVIAVRSVTEVINQFEAIGNTVHSILFRSILNNKEYELLDREVRRQASAFSLGSIPKTMEREMPFITDLCGENSRNAAFPLRSAAMQIKSMEQQINWPAFYGLATSAQEWVETAPLVEPIDEEGPINIAVIRHPALTLGGNGTELLMQALGCNIVDISLDSEATNTRPIHGVYIPHGLGYMVLPKIFSNIYVKTLINRGSTGSSFFLAEGGAAPLLGSGIALPNGYGIEGRGFGIFSFSSRYLSKTPGAPSKVVAKRRDDNPLLHNAEETLRGYLFPNLDLLHDVPTDENCFNLFTLLGGKAAGIDGLCKDRMLVTGMRIEPWGSPGVFKRWLEGVD